MAKRQKLSFCQLIELPDEVILKIMGFLDLKELLLCGQVSKRLRAISNDESLWLKLNLSGREIPYDFIAYDTLHMTGQSESPLKLEPVFL